MLVHILKVLHHEQIPMAQIDIDDVLGSPVANSERACRPNAEARDAGGVDLRFVVTVPSHAVLSVPVPIDQHTIVLSPGQLHDLVCERPDIAIQRT